MAVCTTVSVGCDFKGWKFLRCWKCSRDENSHGWELGILPRLEIFPSGNSHSWEFSLHGWKCFPGVGIPSPLSAQRCDGVFVSALGVAQSNDYRSNLLSRLHRTTLDKTSCHKTLLTDHCQLKALQKRNWATPLRSRTGTKVQTEDTFCPMCFNLTEESITPITANDSRTLHHQSLVLCFANFRQYVEHGFSFQFERSVDLELEDWTCIPISYFLKDMAVYLKMYPSSPTHCGNYSKVIQIGSSVFQCIEV